MYCLCIKGSSRNHTRSLYTESRPSQDGLGLNSRHLLPSIPVSFLILFATVPVFADSIMVETDSELYFTDDTMIITGHVSNWRMPVIAMIIFDPDGGILSANNVPIESDGTFTRVVSLDSPFYDKTGLYLIAVEYGKESAFTIFEVISGKDVKMPPGPSEVKPKVTKIETDRKSYGNDDRVAISGQVSLLSDPTILIGIYNPDESPAGFYIANIESDLRFSTTFLAKSGVNFKTPGTYHVKAYYADTSMSTTFSFASSMTQSQPVQNKEQSNTVTPAPAQSSPAVVNEQGAGIIETERAGHVQRDTIVRETDNLSIEDVELGKMLNEIMLGCDMSEFKDDIVYNDNMGPALIRLCKYEQAITYFDNALMTNPKNIEVHSNKGSALAKIGKYNEAIIHYDAALEINPNFVPALNNKANALAESGRIDDAISIYDVILKIEPSYTMGEKNLEKAKIKHAEFDKRNEKATEIAIAYSEEQPRQMEVIKPSETTEEKTQGTSQVLSVEKGFFEQIGNMFSLIGTVFSLLGR